jgi:peptidoglycan/xylan/chitin deacetylase (PgdA/CDA1 family)
MRRLVLIAALLLLGVAGLHLLFPQGASGVYLFDGIKGPAGRAVAPTAPPARIADYDHGSDHRLAVLVTDPTSSWLGLARGLKAHGIPFTMTVDVSRALRHKVVLVYPTISGKALKEESLRALEAHVREGGSILAFDLEGGGLQALFGVAGPARPDAADTLRWVKGTDVPEEAVTRISRTASEDRITAQAYEPTTGDPLAFYEDGGGALVCRKQAGRACVLGVDLGALTERALNGRGEAIARAYVNAYEPSLDTLYAWVADFYVQGEPMPWLIGTAPAGHDFSLILTHDIDFTRSVASARHSAAAFHAEGVKATFFMQTKYVRDFNDDVFFNADTLPNVQALIAAGMEVGSHSVAHARTFKAFPFGDGREAYPRYKPFVQSRTETRGGSVLGELRVSKFLLDRLAGADVVSFRAGYLSNPFRLSDGLAATGYRYDSSITADASLTHLPFQLVYGRAGGVLAPVYEFPVTIEDEAAPALVSRVDSANQVIGKIAAHHGLAVILVHPDAAQAKLAAEQAFVAKWRDRAWIGTLRAFGDWWRARDGLEVDIDQGAGGWRLILPPGAYRDITLELPKAKGLSGAGHPLTFAHNHVAISGAATAQTLTLH